LNFLDIFSNNTHIVELPHTDGQTDTQTDMAKKFVAFLNSANMPEKTEVIYLTYIK